MNQEKNLAMLSEMFPNVDKSVVQLIMNESGTTDRAISKLLVISDPNARISRTNSPSTSRNDLRVNEDGVTDEQLAYALAMQLAEEDLQQARAEKVARQNEKKAASNLRTLLYGNSTGGGLKKSHSRSNSNLSNKERPSTGSSADDLTENLKRKFNDINGATQRKARQIYEKLTNKNSDRQQLMADDVQFQSMDDEDNSPSATASQGQQITNMSPKVSRAAVTSNFTVQTTPIDNSRPGSNVPRSSARAQEQQPEPTSPFQSTHSSSDFWGSDAQRLRD